jgi:hypothetical protein
LPAPFSPFSPQSAHTPSQAAELRLVQQPEPSAALSWEVPVGAAVGGVAGAIVGGLAGQQEPQFKQYVVTQKAPSYTYKEEVRVGAVLPQSGVTYYEVPAEYGVKGYRYTVVNETPVLVDPGTRRIVQVIGKRSSPDTKARGGSKGPPLLSRAPARNQ